MGHGASQLGELRGGEMRRIPNLLRLASERRRTPFLWTSLDRSEHWDAPKFGGQEDMEKQALWPVIISANKIGEDQESGFLEGK